MSHVQYKLRPSQKVVFCICFLFFILKKQIFVSVFVLYSF